MKVETKYKVGDEFFGFKDNRVVKFYINEISISFRLDRLPKITYDCFTTESEFYGKFDEIDTPKHFILTKEELLAKL